MKLGIIFGGNSYEHEISIVSAISLKKVIPSLSVFIFMDNQHNFYNINANDMKASFFSNKTYEKNKTLEIDHFGFMEKKMIGTKAIEVDAYLNVVHGGDGEDGTLASLLDFYKIKYIGPRKEASVLSFDKYLTKLYATSLGVKTLDYVVASSGDEVKIPFDYPVIVKPTKLGSSLGVSIAKEESELEYALDIAYEYDKKALIEPFMQGVKEYNVAGYKANDLIAHSIIEEPQKEEFLDFDKKYMDFSRTEQVFKADIDEALEEALKNSFSTIYNTLFDGSLIRCDFFVIDNEVYLNEINPVPGSLSNYLFNDFNETIQALIKYLPVEHKIPVSYQYINKIRSAKGK